VCQQDAYRQTRDAVKTMCNPPPLFKGNISVAACMLLYTIKINGGVECRCVWKTRYSRRI